MKIIILIISNFNLDIFNFAPFFVKYDLIKAEKYNGKTRWNDQVLLSVDIQYV